MKSTEQKRSSPQRNQEENNQATILVPDTQNEMVLPARIKIFYFKTPIKPTGHSKGYPQNK